MKSRFYIKILMGLLVTLGQVSFAHAMACDLLLQDFAGLRQMAQGPAGFLTAKEPYSIQLESSLRTDGVAYAWIAIFPVTTIEEAEKHSENNTPRLPDGSLDYRMQPYYLVGDHQVTSEKLGELSVQDREKLLAKSSAYWRSPSGEMIPAPDSLFIESLNPETMVVETSNTYPSELVDEQGRSLEGPAYLLQPAWILPSVRGIIEYAALEEKKKTYKGIKQHSRKNIKAGYSVKVNGDFRGALRLAQNTQHSTYNRYDEKKVAGMLALFETGNAFSIELYDPDNRLVAAEIGTIFGGHVKGDTVALDEGHNINYAKILELFLVEWLAQQGIYWTDSGTRLTPYSIGLGGRYVPIEEWRKGLKELPDVLPLPVDPREHGFFHESIAPAENNQKKKKKKAS